TNPRKDIHQAPKGRRTACDQQAEIGDARLYLDRATRLPAPGERISRAAQRWGANLLDSYHTERHPVAARVLATTCAQLVLMNPPPDADDRLALREIVTDLA